MLDSALAAFTDLSRGNMAAYAALTDKFNTAAALARVAETNQLANASMAQGAMGEIGAIERNRDTIDYNKWVANEELKAQRRRSRQQALQGLLGGGGFAGGRLGISPSRVGSVSAESMAQTLNSLLAQTGAFANTDASVARYIGPAAAYVPRPPQAGAS